MFTPPLSTPLAVCTAVALDLQDVSKHYNFISRKSHQRRRGEGVRNCTDGWKYSSVAATRGVYESNKNNKNLSTVPPENHCLLYLPCRSGFV